MRDKEGKTCSHPRKTPNKDVHQKKTNVLSKDNINSKQLQNRDYDRHITETNSNSKFKLIKKSPIKTLNTNSDSSPCHGDNDSVTSHGMLKQYCLKGSEVFMRDIHYLKNEKSKMLMITVDDKQHQTDTYTILSTKDVCPFTFKDRNAFVLKVLDINQKLKSMTFQAITDEEKKIWIHRYSLNMGIASDLLNTCIKEVEKRRFQLGVKKRSEEKSKIKVDADSLSNLVNSLLRKQEVDLHSDSKWTVGNLERLIQLLLNELWQPLIDFSAQRNIRKVDYDCANIDYEARLIINGLPTINRTMLTLLLNHMERLSKYYLIVMSSPKKILPQIRRNICRRLSPIVFRIQNDLENDTISSRCTEMLYNIMIIINNVTEDYE